jgi:multidrug efflux pump subunit AcrA (membrane-fusion protein)
LILSDSKLRTSNSITNTIIMFSNSNSKFLPPVQDNEFLPPIHRWTTFGGLAIVFTVALAIPIASVAKYKETVKAEAIVRPVGELRIVQTAVDGAIINIAVKENQFVQQGDAVATVDDSRLETKKRQLQSSIQQAQLQSNQINAQMNAQTLITGAEVAEAQADLGATEAAFQTARAKRDRYQPIAELGALSKNDFEEAQLAAEQQSQAVAAAQARVQRAKAGLTKEQERLIQQRLELHKLIAQDQYELQQVQNDLSQTQIKATADGIITKLNLRNSGQMVSAGQEIAQIVPSHVPLTIKALVPSQERSKLKKDQKVQMRVSACPYPDYGTLKGQVKTISSDAFGGGVPQAFASQEQDDATTDSTTASSPKNSSGSAFYEVMIEPESFSFGQPGNRQCDIKAGMDGRVDIIAREETVLQFFLRKSRLMTDL